MTVVNRFPDLARSVHVPWTAAGYVLRTPRYARLEAGQVAVPVLLHHGFLIDGNAPWYCSGLVRQLQEGGRDVVLVTEHHVRRVDDARAFGHACDLLLAETLALVVDSLGVPEIDVVAYGAGCAPALIAAANDGRIRRLALRGVASVPLAGSGLKASVAPAADWSATAAELDLGLRCQHGRVAPLRPARAIRMGLRDVAAETLLIGTGGDGPAVRRLAEVLPRATSGTWPRWGESAARDVAGFLEAGCGGR